MAMSSGSTPPLTPHGTPSENQSTLPHINSPRTSRASTPELSPEEERARRRAIVQPAFFYPNSGASDPANDHSAAAATRDDPDEEFLDPAEDPRATRGIPVFRPTLAEFEDFEGYMERIEEWGRRSGIVKVIPPKAWTQNLSNTAPRLPHIKLKHPIEQHMIGRTGLFRQQNEERRHTYSVRDWAALCAKDGLRAPAPKDIVQAELKARRSRRARKGEDTAEDEKERAELEKLVEQTREARGTREGESIRPEDEYYNSFEPLEDWLPPGTKPEDYTPAVCRALERHYWRNCGLGKDPMYGADMQGSLFDPKMKTWNVSCLPNLLSRLLPSGNTVPGVNTPYLYFGMWRATFAWHVEDMDLYSINYIHWGAPKYWYAIPSMRADAFEQTMRKHFTAEATECPQFMRHKSFLASPAILGETDCRPNTLVQHQGEFVITYPRGYHAGFNVGFNCAESVNFALDSWIELGRRAQVCKCVGDSVHLDVDAILAEREAELNGNADVDVGVDSVNTHLPPRFAAASPSRKRKAPPVERSSSKRPRTASAPTRDPKVAYATAAELDQLPTIKIKIKPAAHSTLAPIPSPPRPRAQAGSYGARMQPANSSLPRLKIPAMLPPPCCLCVSTDQTGLLPLRDPPPHAGHGHSPGRTQGSWQAHEACAQVVPETWVVKVDGGKFVCGVGAVVKDRWALKCSICTKTSSKAHGAKIQCAKGKCPKAFHVSCARDDPGVEFTTVSAEGREGSGSAEGGGKRLAKQSVTALCPQHNPRLVEARKADKQQKLDSDIGALTQYSRIKVRASGGVFAVTLVNVYEDRRMVEVVWDQGSTKEFRYSSVVWSEQPDEAVQEKPTSVTAQLTTQIPSGHLAQQPAHHLCPSPTPTPLSTQGANISHPSATSVSHPSRPSSAASHSYSAGPSSNHAQSRRTYTFQAYHPSAYSHSGYAYPSHPQARYSHTPPSSTLAPPTGDQLQAQPTTPHQLQAPLHSNPPPQPPQSSYTVPMPLPVQYPYPYRYYEQQQGYLPQPLFYPAQGYHYPPVTTYHAAGPSPAARISTIGETGNVKSGASTRESVEDQSRPPAQSYVGVRPASSEEILRGVHHAR